MGNICWHYPEQIKKALGLIENHRAVPHGGGTHLTGKRLMNESSFVSLDRLSLHYVTTDQGSISIGAATDYNSIAQQLKTTIPGHILIKSLGQAATTPLRNRITIGGSLALAPNWSDLTGPLVALEALVKLQGTSSGTYPVMEYLTSKTLQSKTLITEIELPKSHWESWYYREGITKNDHPVFTLTILAKRTAHSVEDVRIAITGHTHRFMRATEIENQLKGKALNQIQTAGIASKLALKFAPAKGMSSGYIRHLAETYLERGLTELLKS
jgi:CO/xanthine dehydrogenase FAD-binding subunit